MMRRLLVAVVGVMAGAAFLAALPSTPASAATSRDDAIAEVQNVRVSIDLTLSLIKQGRSAEAFTAAANGYLNHFELVEVPLRIIDNDLTIETEGRFADIRQLIRNHAPVDRIRDELIGLRGALDTIERKLTATGAAAPALIFGQSFLIIFREGFEVVLLVSILLGYLEAARSTAFIRPILIGIGAAFVATILTVVVMRLVFESLAVLDRSARGRHGDDRRGHALLRVVLARGANGAQTLDGVRARPLVERRVAGLDVLADHGRLHSCVPRGLRDGAVLPGAVVVRCWSRQVGSRRAFHRARRAHRSRAGHVPSRVAACRSSSS